LRPAVVSSTIWTTRRKGSCTTEVVHASSSEDPLMEAWVAVGYAPARLLVLLA